MPRGPRRLPARPRQPVRAGLVLHIAGCTTGTGSWLPMVLDVPDAVGRVPTTLAASMWAGAHDAAVAAETGRIAGAAGRKARNDGGDGDP